MAPKREHANMIVLQSPRGFLPRRNFLTLLVVSLSCSSLHTDVTAFSSYSKNNCLQRNSCSPRLTSTIYSTELGHDDGSNSDSNSDSSPTVFTASQITIDPVIPEPKPTNKDRVKVNSATLQFNNRLSRMTKNYDTKTAPKVEKLLLEAVNNYQKAEEAGKTKHVIAPNTVTFTNAITAWARCTRKDSAKRAQALLDQMHSLYKEKGWAHVKPNKITYNSVITAWARSRERGSALQAEELLRSMYDFYNEEGGGEELKPDSRSWNAVINAVARSRDKNCAHRAKFLLDEMGRLYEEGAEDLQPDALTFGAIINAYANSFEDGASDKASQLLLHMESLSGLGFDKAKPTTFVYNACMNAFAKDPLITRSNSNNAEQAEQLLISMEKRYDEEKDHRVIPDCISYSTVINAYANSKTPQSGIRADAILRRMTNRYLLGDTKCRPNAFAFTAAIKAHSAAIDATADSLDELSPENTIQNNQQMEASAGRCEGLLQQLCLLYQNHGNDRSLKPTSVTFELTTKALAQVEDGEGVERVKLLQAGM